MEQGSSNQIPSIIPARTKIRQGAGERQANGRRIGVTRGHALAHGSGSLAPLFDPQEV